MNSAAANMTLLRMLRKPLNAPSDAAISGTEATVPTSVRPCTNRLGSGAVNSCRAGDRPSSSSSSASEQRRSIERRPLSSSRMSPSSAPPSNAPTPLTA
jgi:hypothetical protein